MKLFFFYHEFENFRIIIYDNILNSIIRQFVIEKTLVTMKLFFFYHEFEIFRIIIYDNILNSIIR